MIVVPDAVARLLEDVELEALDLVRDRALVLERVMSRGTWEAMKWLRSTYRREDFAAFLLSEAGGRVAPRERAYWALIAEVDLPIEPAGDRPPRAWR